ncbi:hypothetical protein TWF730_008887 [Orbilia blumenaviensis]|uniref:Uncharacterized protein n=1 Tax=Orbilia blumenaviensis TaxID=1796055 RepID=A0AAV9V3N6_9PEZI
MSLQKKQYQRNSREDLNSTKGRDLDCLAGFAAGRPELFNGLDNVRALNNLAEDDVGTVEPAGDNGSDGELEAVGLLSLAPLSSSAGLRPDALI